MALSSNVIKQCALLSSLALFSLSSAMADDHINKPVVEQLVDTLSTIAGPHPGIRKNHAKGIVVSGEFTPSPDAATVSNAVHF